MTVGKKRGATRIRNQGRTIGDIADVLRVSKRTLYRYLEKNSVQSTTSNPVPEVTSPSDDNGQ
ncbi:MULTISPECIES: helix-turn-helix domain-containing protein [Nocardiaceae]|uniref:helix-turn-helix domain-containing protein n=1 Tax=Nocardiaceae TaxID=85025 RepID=UPI0035301317